MRSIVYDDLAVRDGAMGLDELEEAKADELATGDVVSLDWKQITDEALVAIDEALAKVGLEVETIVLDDDSHHFRFVKRDVPEEI